MKAMNEYVGEWLLLDKPEELVKIVMHGTLHAPDEANGIMHRDYLSFGVLS